ncbi:phospholipase D family protein [Sedimentitalea sp. JM2-8]|uniref:Phospholipase D n=1 Tax=Sedimentitalea xiamensis TaxID=3050037 RepID=A0ABT7FB41_9RHOB|nr:phospholipase D family protein [Sedimentitalea xiamensis]MDK3072328.1 phospholipase D family protein [Sedimentitalea xiamensis]
MTALKLLFALLLAALVLAGLIGCDDIPQDYDRPVSRAATETDTTYLADLSRRLGNPDDGRSGFYLLPDGLEALAARLVLAERAEKTIDAQYYLVHDDVAGHVFAWELLKAADRGVRVRLLIDDMDTSGYDAMTAALDSHPNIEIRLFNPFWRQRGRALNALFDFQRINRRMHNKSMTFDNQITIVGGRNIGAEYFSANDESNYDDLDVFGAGPVAREISAAFDDYWNSEYAVPASVVIGPADADAVAGGARRTLEGLVAQAAETGYGQALTDEFRSRMKAGRLSLAWTPWKVIADPPEKAAGDLDNLPIVASQMRPYLLNATRDLFVSSAYFVPRAGGEAFLTGLQDKGVQVSILTNSLDSTDVVPVYGHYAKSRKALLDAGVELWELRPDRERQDRSLRQLGLSRSGLHTKAFAIDRRYLFIGSVNWDPRSVRINTEMGILMDAPELTSRVVESYAKGLPARAYRLSLDDSGDITWTAQREDGTTLRYLDEPRASGWSMFQARLFGLLPIAGQL